MVFAVNPPKTGNTFEAFQAAAKKSKPSNSKTTDVDVSGKTGGGSGKTWTVQVGNNGKLEYDPPFITGANPGDTVKFVFHPKNHTVSEVRVFPIFQLIETY